MKYFRKTGLLPVPPVRIKAELEAEALEMAALKKEARKDAILRFRAQKGLQIRIGEIRKRKAEKVAPSQALSHLQFTMVGAGPSKAEKIELEHGVFDSEVGCI